MALYRLARLASLRGDAPRVLEVGSYLGASTCYLAAGVAPKSGTVFCLDTWQNETMPEGRRDTMEAFLENTTRVRQHIRLIRKKSSELVSADLDGPLDLVFIDGDHSFDAVKTDFEIVVPLVKTDGVIAFHDALEAYHPGVPRMIGEVLARGEWVIGGVEDHLLWIVRAASLLGASGTVDASQQTRKAGGP